MTPCEFRAEHRRMFETGVNPLEPARFEVLTRALLEMDKTPEVNNVLELGCFRGGTSRWLLEYGGGIVDHLTVVDTFKGSDEHRDVGVPLEHLKAQFAKTMLGIPDEKLSIFDCTTDEFFRTVPADDHPFALAIVDASHHSGDVLRDAIGAFDRLVVGGILVLDDYGWNYHENQCRNPANAIIAFLNAFVNQLELVEQGYIVVVRKTEKRPYDDLAEFEQWYRANFGYAMLASGIPMAGVNKVGDFMGITVFQKDRYQVQLWIGPAFSRITPHSHPNADSIFLYGTGHIDFEVSGKAVDYDKPVAQNPDGTCNATGRMIRIGPGVEHAATFGAEGGYFIAVQRFLDGPPRSVELDWKGEPLDEHHKRRLEIGVK